ncbi:MAG: phosphatase PAP2 family protein [Nocardioides sp.]|nr:phosphatase PAP2 family protein [Nocardioides sp.]
MTMSISWCVVTLLAVAGVVGALAVAERATGLRGIASTRVALIAAAVCLALLLGLGGLYQVRGIAVIDGRAVEKLSTARGDVLVQVFRVLTTMGDAVPCMVIAGSLAIVLMRLPGIGLWPFALPVLVLVQLLLQFAYDHVFAAFTLTDVMPGLSIDGSGSVPSGSVARFLSIFLVAEMIRRRARPDSPPSPLPTVGAVLVLVELVTRLYLGRHLLADILGGLLLGVLLVLAAGALLQVTSRRAPSVGN